MKGISNISSQHQYKIYRETIINFNGKELCKCILRAITREWCGIYNWTFLRARIHIQRTIPDCAIHVLENQGSIARIDIERINYSVLNLIIVMNKYSLPRVHELLDQLWGGSILSKINLLSRYHKSKYGTRTCLKWPSTPNIAIINLG